MSSKVPFGLAAATVGLATIYARQPHQQTQELTEEENSRLERDQAAWKRYEQAADNPRILKYKPVQDLTMAELAVELEGFRGLGTIFNSLKVTQPTSDFLEHSKRLATFTDCIDATKKTDTGELDSSAVERCKDVRSAMFKAIDKERLERYPMLDPDKYNAAMSAIFK